ncbi:hypothetical protein N658DRAFT_406826, partial [Parathielavia hyrcaniae]
MPGTFFTSWDLWQQMTFVLAMAIVAVFCAGLGKLWWNNRLMKKQEVLDEEKRARTEDMRKTGLPIKRANPVPFGVRAIQSGIEVDGIWISRPASLNEPGEILASSTTLAGRDSDSQRNGRDYSEDEQSVVVTTTSRNHAGHTQSPSAASIFQRLNDTDSTESSQSSAPPMSQFAPQTNKRQPSRQLVGTLSEATLRRLEGQSPNTTTKSLYETYVPTPPPGSSTTRRSQHRPRRPPWHPSQPQTSSESSSAESVDSQPRSETNKSASGRSYTSSSSTGRRTEAQQNATALRRWAEKERDKDKNRKKDGGRGPFELPPPAARTPTGLSVFPQAEVVAMAVPEPTFGPGDLHFNTSTR